MQKNWPHGGHTGKSVRHRRPDLGAPQAAGMPVPRDRGAAEDTGKSPQADLAFGGMLVPPDSGEPGDLIVTSCHICDDPWG